MSIRQHTEDIWESQQKNVTLYPSPYAALETEQDLSEEVEVCG
jgi:hypothetical protein